VAVDDVSFANAPWGSRPEMATIKSFETQLQLLPLIFGDIKVNRIVLKGADILLETNAKGENNWTFGEAGAAQAETAPPGGAGKLPTVNEISFEDVTITYKDGVANKTQTAAFQKFSAGMADANSPIELEIVANLNNNPISASGTIGSLAGIAANQPLPIDIKAEGGGTTMAAKGTIEQPAAGKGVAIALTAEGKSLADMTPLAGSELPPLGPYSFSGTLSDADGGYQVAGMQLKMGGSDIAGDASIALGGERPKIVAKLSSSLLDAKDFGLKPAPAEGEAAPAAKSGDGRVFPDEPLPFDALKAVDAKIDFTGQKVIREPVTFDGLAVALDLAGGKLTIGKIDAGVTGGTMRLAGVVDGSAKTPAVAINLTTRGVEAGTLMHTLGQSAILSGGKMDMDIDVNGAGSSMRQIMAGLNGNVGMQMGSGKINNRFARIVLSDLFQLISTGSADSSNLNCFLTKFDIAKGMATAKALALDTNGATINGSGNINLANEKLDMHLDPTAKQTNLVRIAIPVTVGGTLASPSVMPDPGALVKGAAGALVGTAEGGGDAVGALTGLVTDAAGGGTAQPAAPSATGCGVTAAAAPAPAATTEPAQQPAATPESATDQLIQQGTEQGKKGVEDAVKGLFD
jgi:uncharacterized protein involved in outer membrane biogenesis